MFCGFLAISFFKCWKISSSFLPFKKFIKSGTSSYFSKIGVISLAKSKITGPLKPSFVKIKSPVSFRFLYFGIFTFNIAFAIVSALQEAKFFSFVKSGIIAGEVCVIV